MHGRFVLFAVVERDLHVGPMEPERLRNIPHDNSANDLLRDPEVLRRPVQLELPAPTSTSSNVVAYSMRPSRPTDARSTSNEAMLRHYVPNGSAPGDSVARERPLGEMTSAKTSLSPIPSGAGASSAWSCPSGSCRTDTRMTIEPPPDRRADRMRSERVAAEPARRLVGNLENSPPARYGATYSCRTAPRVALSM